MVRNIRIKLILFDCGSEVGCALDYSEGGSETEGSGNQNFYCRTNWSKKNSCVKLWHWEVSHEVQQTIKVADVDDLKMWGDKTKGQKVWEKFIIIIIINFIILSFFINIIVIIFLLVSSPKKEVLNSVHHTPISSVKYHFQYFPLTTERPSDYVGKNPGHIQYQRISLCWWINLAHLNFPRHDFH